MQIVTLYLITAVVFLALDIVMLKRVLYPLFSSNLGDWLLEDPRMGPAAVFYLFYVGGVLFFAFWPVFNSGNLSHVLMWLALYLEFSPTGHMNLLILLRFGHGLRRWL